ncbi:Clp protease N-terminal domain-containing protein [Nocardioides houyundeii]|uniref:Clp protease N-terminal domain-containing protein n=1 Tax=Nocardioides houyundeii TaxID=2045452 RepID=UPI000C76CB08|nr:Clp protease N-terminal domain-containing protein [Nocardioides houyundeii]
MFERFTKQARAVVTDAQVVARDAASRSIDTRHLLISLVQGPGPARRALGAAGGDVEAILARARADVASSGLDADALAGIGIDLDAVRRQTDEVFGAGALEWAGRRSGGHIPFTPDAKKTLELALREAIRLKDRGIHSAHLMLGLVLAEGPGRALLEGSGVDLDVLRSALAEQPDAA